jgi:hypothetical protein
MRRVLSLAAVLLLAVTWSPAWGWGYTWTKPGQTQETFNSDSVACGAINGHVPDEGTYNPCMFGRGWKIDGMVGSPPPPISPPIIYAPPPISPPPPPVYVNPGVEAGRRGMNEVLRLPPPPIQCFAQPDGRGWSTTCPQ